jgi:NAD(P)-dependent dehydrogenase (short-subunit alcohol dehydrogenase family)
LVFLALIVWQNQSKLAEMVVLITGASSGIGLAVARYLSGRGFAVYGASRSAPPSNEFYVLKMDVCDDMSVQRAIKEIIGKEGRIDVLVNNAGIGSIGAVEKTPISDVQQSFDVNFFGVLRVTQAVLPHMRQHQFGRIINMSTLGSMIGLPFRAFYSASKGAVDLTTEALRLECEKFGIGACTIHPGEVKTNIANSRVISTGAEDEHYGKAIKSAFDKLNQSIETSKDPALFGPLIEKIIYSKKVKRNYYVGTFDEIVGINLKKFLPHRAYEWILRKYFAAEN